MRRFAFLIPRLVILGLVCCAGWLAKDPLLRRAAIHYGQKTTSAKVEIGHLQTDLKQNRVLLKNIRIADPRNPMTNLIQADLAYLKLDADQLWRRKFVVTEGQVHGLIVNAPRTESGALNPYRSTDIASGSHQAEMLEQTKFRIANVLEQISQKWLNKIDTSATPTIPDSEGAARAQQLIENWRGRVSELSDKSAQLEPVLADVMKLLGLGEAFPNPLRDRQRVEGSLEELTALQNRAQQLQTEVAASLKALDSETAQLQTLIEQEVAEIQPDRPANQFDDALVSELLLTQDGHELVADIVSWLTWFRNTVPQQTPANLSPSSGGTDLTLESAASPDFVLQKVELEGNGWFARQHLNFVGTVFNLSAQPQLQSEPTRIDLRALGKSNVLISCVVDRRANVQLDQLRIQFPELEFAPRQVGHDRSMLVTFGNGRRANADIVLEVDGDRIKGDIKLRFSQAALHVDQLSNLAGGDDTRLRINQALNQLGQFKANLTISGSIDQYDVQLESDLGQQFVQIVDSAVIARVTLQNQRLLENLKQRSAELTKVVDTELRPGLQQLLTRLSGETQRIAQLRNDVEEGEKSGWSKLR